MTTVEFTALEWDLLDTLASVAGYVSVKALLMALVRAEIESVSRYPQSLQGGDR